MTRFQLIKSSILVTLGCVIWLNCVFSKWLW